MLDDFDGELLLDLPGVLELVETAREWVHFAYVFEIVCLFGIEVGGSCDTHLAGFSIVC